METVINVAFMWLLRPGRAAGGKHARHTDGAAHFRGRLAKIWLLL